MKNKKCVVCSKVKGKRLCHLNDNTLICPRCCAQIRNHDCEGCRYYANFEQHAKTKQLKKLKALKAKPFIVRMAPEVNKLADQALAMVESGNLAAGESIISDLLKKHPDIHTVQYAMGVVCAMKGQYDESIAYFDKAIEIFPYFVEAWFNKGTSYQRKLDVVEAIRAFQKVVALGDPAESFVGRTKEIVTGIEKQIYEENGLSLDAYLSSNDMFEKALAAMQDGEYEKAIEGFQAVVAVNRKSPQSYGKMGNCYRLLGKKEEALAAFDRALELEPKYEPAILNRALLSFKKKGEELPKEPKIRSVDYYKDSPLQKKSLLERFFERFSFNKQ